MAEQSPDIIGLAEQIGYGPAKPLLSADARQILQLLLEHPQGILTSSITTGLGLTSTVVAMELSKLAEDAIATQFHIQRGVPVTAWTLTKRGRSVARAMANG